MYSADVRGRRLRSFRTITPITKQTPFLLCSVRLSSSSNLTALEGSNRTWAWYSIHSRRVVRRLITGGRGDSLLRCWFMRQSLVTTGGVGGDAASLPLLLLVLYLVCPSPSITQLIHPSSRLFTKAPRSRPELASTRALYAIWTKKCKSCFNSSQLAIFHQAMYWGRNPPPMCLVSPGPKVYSRPKYRFSWSEN